MSAWILLLALLPLQDEASGVRVLFAERLHVGNGSIMKNAIVTLEGGKIRSLAQGPPPAGAVHVEGAELTPGLVDAYSYLGVTDRRLRTPTIEQSSEVTAANRLLESARLDDRGFRRAVEQGVTAAFLSPDSLNVFGGVGGMVKTAGGHSADLFAEEGSGARVLEGGAALKVSLGSDPGRGNYAPVGSPPYNFFGRRPTTRMGTVWIIRREFFRARRYRSLRGEGKVPGDPGLDVLVEVLDGRLPIRVQARLNNDVQTALRLQKELGWQHMILEEGTEAWRAADLLAEANVPVVTGPAFDIVSRSIARGPMLEDFQPAVRPHPPDVPSPLDASGFQEDSAPPIQARGRALELLLSAMPRYSAVGLQFGRRREAEHPTPANAALLQAAGVDVSLGAAEAHNAPATDASLIQQARIAARYGLGPEIALQAVTLRPARLCGMDAHFGSVETGKDADLVLWSGPPLDPTSRPLLVLIDGQVVFDARPSRTSRP
ncbi:MAG: amidohydrolase family protein [Planctomycetota bacterium]